MSCRLAGRRSGKSQVRRNDEFYGSLSYWRDSVAGFPIRPEPDRSKTYDVVIVGGGFHGLWTAYHLHKADPSLDIAIVEQSHVGFGASGRNGGFAMSKVGLRFADLEAKYGAAPVRRVYDVMGQEIDALVRTIAAEGIDCEVDAGGLLIVATNAAQERRLEAELDAARRIGIADFEPLSGAEVRLRVNSPIYRRAAYERHAAVLHPLKLALGIADVVSRAGVAIFEDSRMLDIDVSKRVPLVRTAKGDIRARKVVMTVNAWAGREPRFTHTIVPVYTYILATEPLDDATWAGIGWAGREGIEDSRSHLHFYRRTRDGRLLFGGTDNVIPFLGVIDKHNDSNSRCFERLRRAVSTVFPQLADVRFEYAWGGAFAMTPDFIPRYGAVQEGKLVFGHGCCGHGVALSYLGGQIMRDLVLERAPAHDDLFFMPVSDARYPAEPLKSVGGMLTLAEARWHDDAQDLGRPASQEPLLLRLATKLFA